jgi:hypothetical protein
MVIFSFRTQKVVISEKSLLQFENDGFIQQASIGTTWFGQIA